MFGETTARTRSFLGGFSLLYIRTYIRTYIHTCIHACMHAYIHAYMYTYLHACMHDYIHTNMYTYTNIHMHTYRDCTLPKYQLINAEINFQVSKLSIKSRDSKIAVSLDTAVNYCCVSACVSERESTVVLLVIETFFFSIAIPVSKNMSR